PMTIFDYSNFVILSTFVIRISSLSRPCSRQLLQNYERPSLRLPQVAEDSWLHRRRRAHACARHRSEHGRFPTPQRGALENTAAVEASGIDRGPHYRR